MNWIKSWWTKLTEAPKIDLPELLQNFTPRAQKVIELAQKQAVRLGHSFIGTEHVLLGLLELGQGIACTVLLRFGVQYEAMRKEMERLIPFGDSSLSSRPPTPTPRVEKVLSWAKKEADTLRHQYIGTEHLLLGLLSEPDGVAARLLQGFDVNLKRARREIIRELDPNSVSGEDEQGSTGLTDSK
ncbi:MAG TPA: Clp protease N-terminal domain-containing protein [Verrucomicrobiae bacterium]|nr:Clp protease N-terminal domain-containing protein [Verrucomicrobiae bacterium]